MENATVPTAANGGSDRGENGRFLLGNRAAMGNPSARKVQLLRAALLRAVGSGDLRAVVKKLVDQAKAGDVQASRLLLDRLLGPCLATDIESRLSELETKLAERKL